MNAPLDLAAWHLERHGEHLIWSGSNLSDLARRYGTPLFVFNRHRLEQSYREIAEAFGATGLDSKIFFSFKTNPVPEVLKTLIGCGAGAEVVSEFELWLAKKLGVPGDSIVVNGSVKSREQHQLAIESGATLINVESAAELRMIRELAVRLGQPANIGLRMNPALKSGRFDFTTSTGSATCHIGLIPNGTEWKAALKIIKEEPALRLRGLHFHIGSGIGHAKPYAEALNVALRTWESLLDSGFMPSVLDIGGGFQISTLKVFGFLDAVRFFGWNKGPENHFRRTRENFIQLIARLCAERLHDFSRTHGCPLPVIYTEPGRALVASSALLLLTVGGVVERRRGRNFAICDGGAMSVSPLLLSESHTILVSNRNSSGASKRYNLVGNLPTPLDVISMGKKLPELAIGDTIAVMDTGAYFTSLGNNFAGPRPAIVMIEDSAASLIRRRETYEDLVARDVIFSDIRTR
jgi:diaminopimelate decarboxylase